MPTAFGAIAVCREQHTFDAGDKGVGGDALHGHRPLMHADHEIWVMRQMGGRDRRGASRGHGIPKGEGPVASDSGDRRQAHSLPAHGSREVLRRDAVGQGRAEHDVVVGEDAHDPYGRLLAGDRRGHGVAAPRCPIARAYSPSAMVVTVAQSWIGGVALLYAVIRPRTLWWTARVVRRRTISSSLSAR